MREIFKEYTHVPVHWKDHTETLISSRLAIEEEDGPCCILYFGCHCSSLFYDALILVKRIQSIKRQADKMELQSIDRPKLGA